LKFDIWYFEMPVLHLFERSTIFNGWSLAGKMINMSAMFNKAINFYLIFSFFGSLIPEPVRQLLSKQ